MSRTRLSPGGFTLIEAMVVMVVFSVVLLIVAKSFSTILSRGQVTFGIEQSNMEGVVGLELLRHDLQQAGFGLFTVEDNELTFGEAVNKPFSDYNDTNGVPRPIVTGDNLTPGISGDPNIVANTDRLTIKGMTVSLSEVSRKWSYITSNGMRKRWGTEDFNSATDNVIVVAQDYDKAKNRLSRTLIRTNSQDYAFSYYSTGSFTTMGNAETTLPIPQENRRYYLYGISSKEKAEEGFSLQAPFNRSDYTVRRPSGIPASCSPAAGSLYKMVMNQSNGEFTSVPILDCVADMQVVLGWNTEAEPGNSREINAFSDAKGEKTSGNTNGKNIKDIMKDSHEVRKRLRMIKVYLLAQEGYRDKNFTNTNTAMVTGNPDLGETSLTNTVDLTTPDMRNYRWKLYWIVVRPKNL